MNTWRVKKPSIFVALAILFGGWVLSFIFSLGTFFIMPLAWIGEREVVYHQVVVVYFLVPILAAGLYYYAGMRKYNRELEKNV